MDKELIAPCGMNCSLCINYQSVKNELNKKGFHKTYCPGCIPRNKNCTFMKSSCDLVGNGLIRFCYECEQYPCKRLKALDYRYRTKYHMSMIENLNQIKGQGMETFLSDQDMKWKCPSCGGRICCHNGLCLQCNLETLITKKTYRWGK